MVAVLRTHFPRGRRRTRPTGALHFAFSLSVYTRFREYLVVSISVASMPRSWSGPFRSLPRKSRDATEMFRAGERRNERLLEPYLRHGCERLVDRSVSAEIAVYNREHILDSMEQRRSSRNAQHSSMPSSAALYRAAVEWCKTTLSANKAEHWGTQKPCNASTKDVLVDVALRLAICRRPHSSIAARSDFVFILARFHTANSGYPISNCAQNTGVRFRPNEFP